MLPADCEHSDSADQRLDQVVAAYLRAVEDGDTPDREQLLVAHPDLAARLREFFQHRDRMEQMLEPLRNAAQRVLNIRCPHCHNAVELLNDIDVTDLSCPSCGSSFSLIGPESACFPGGLQRIGQFRLIEQVGVGRFGSVWKAQDLTLERMVAIKIPRNDQLTPAETEMFLRDARFAAQLNHPNIVGVHEVGRQDRTIYIVSDFIDGESLKERLSRHRLTAEEAAELCLELARALHHAHQCGVVHRDLKPGNIMLDARSEPHIVDFGLAKRDSGEITMTLEGQILGTPAYMAPEQARGDAHHVDCRSDVYSLGVILFEMLTGELPFRGEKNMLLVQIQEDDPPACRHLNDSVPRDLETICLKCLEKEPARRYETAGDLAADFRRFLDQQPILARPVGRIERAGRWCRRNPRVALLSGSVLAMLLMIAVVSPLVALHQAGLRRERERALGAQQAALVQARHASLQALLTSSTDEVLQVLRSMQWHVADIESELVARLQEGPGAKERLHLQLARLLHTPEPIDYLCQRMIDPETDPRELRVICQALQEFADPTRLEPSLRWLWRVTLDTSAEPPQRFRAACSLATFDSQSADWETVADELVYQLMTQPPVRIPDWLILLQPIAPVLHGPIEEIFLHTESDTERVIATMALLVLLEDDTDPIVELIKLADARDLPGLIRKLRPQREVALALLDAEVRRVEPVAVRASRLSPWKFPATLRSRLEAAGGYVSPQFAICYGLPLEQFPDLSEQMRPGNYRPLRCRPYRVGDQLLAAVIWTRDSETWAAQLGLSVQRMESFTERYGRQDLWPVDLACYEDRDGQWQMVAIWSGQPTPPEGLRLSMLIPQADWQAAFESLRAQKGIPVTTHIFRAAGGQLRRCQIWQQNEPYRYYLLRSQLSSSRSVTNVTEGRILQDFVCYEDDDGLHYGAVWHRDQKRHGRVYVGMDHDSFLRLCDERERRNFQPSALSVIRRSTEGPAKIASAWQRHIQSREARARDLQGKANLAIALFQLGEPSAVLTGLNTSAPPLLRSELITRLALARTSPQELIRVLNHNEQPPSVRQGLLLALGEYTTRALSQTDRRQLYQQLRELYQRDPDPGVHHAALWLLTNWLKRGVPATLSEPRSANSTPRWDRNGQDQTLVVTQIPPTPAEIRRNIATAPLDGRVIVVGAHEVTHEQFQRFRPGHQADARIPEQQPATHLSWYDAVAYCQWLNLQEAVPQSQWCYLPNAEGEYAEGMRLAPDFLARRGYRLLTVEEWHFVAAGGSGDARPLHTDRLSDRFAWTAENARLRPAAAGRLYPNPLGIFDIYGNVAEWCHRVTTDAGLTAQPTLGGHFSQLLWQVDAEYASSELPSAESNQYTGFRAARTQIGSTLEVFAETERLARQRQWDEAYRALQKALRQRPDEWFYQGVLARLALYLGHRDEHRRLCASLVERFLDPKHRAQFTPQCAASDMAHDIAGVSAGAATAFEDWSQPVSVAEVAARRLGYRGQRTLAAVRFRTGEYPVASELLEQARRKEKGYGRLIATIFQSMCYQQLGRTSEARSCFAEAVGLERELAGSSDNDLGSRWRDWLYCQALLAEAQSMLSPSPLR